MELPWTVTEPSGLATTDDGRLLVHDDEVGVVHEVDPARGTIVRSFPFGSPPPRADFEGVAVAGARVFLVTSDGVVLSAPEGGGAVARLRPQAADRCEWEGLAFDPVRRSLLLACKEPRASWHDFGLVVLPVPPGGEPEGNPLLVPRRVLKAHGYGELHPSAIEVEPTTGTYVLLAARERALVALTAVGEVLAIRALPGRHGQAEGLAFLQDGTMVIADEGRPATLTLYPRR